MPYFDISDKLRAPFAGALDKAEHNRDRSWLTFLTVSSVFQLIYNSGRNVCIYGKLQLSQAKATVRIASAAGQIAQENILALKETKKRAL